MGWPRHRIALLLVLASISLLGFALQQTDNLRPVEALAASLTSPVQTALSDLIRNARGFSVSFQEAEALRDHNQELQELVDKLLIENVRLREAEIENVELRRQLNFKQANPTYDLVSASVIGRDSNGFLNSIILDRGHSDGIERGMPVVTSQGLVGRIAEATDATSKALLITDPSSSVNAITQSSRSTGIVQGRPAGAPVMKYIPQGDEVNVGDIVLTSGLGGNFPNRIVIGQIVEVRRQDIELFQSAAIQPSAPLEKLEMVMVMRNFQPSDISELSSEERAEE